MGNNIFYSITPLFWRIRLIGLVLRIIFVSRRHFYSLTKVSSTVLSPSLKQKNTESHFQKENAHVPRFRVSCSCCVLCWAVRRKEDGTLRTMNAEKLLKTLPVLQAQLDSLLEFDCSANDLTNGVINMTFMLLFRDLIRLFACYNDGIINLLGKGSLSLSLSARRLPFIVCIYTA